MCGNGGTHEHRANQRRFARRADSNGTPLLKGSMAMSEMPNMRTQGTTGQDVPDEQAHLLALDLAGFSPDEARRLLATRAQIEQGTRNEWTEDANRLRFARWLFEQGHLQS